MLVTVWTKPSCVQCTAVKRAFDKAGVVYTTKNLPDFPDVLEKFITAGHMGAPVVQAVGVEEFAGFNPDLVKAVIALHTRAA